MSTENLSDLLLGLTAEETAEFKTVARGKGREHPAPLPDAPAAESLPPNLPHSTVGLAASFSRAGPAADPHGVEVAAALQRSALAGRHMLVLLDNATDVQRVLPQLLGSPGSAVIITSRGAMAARPAPTRLSTEASGWPVRSAMPGRCPSGT